jgi:hypothetical protein
MMDRSSFSVAVPAGPSSATSPNNAQVPLLQFGDDGDLHRSPTSPDIPYHPNNRLSHMPTSNSTSQLLPPTRPIDRMSKSNSVFGIDQIWESEMARLKIRQAQEAEHARIVQEREEEEERRKRERKEKKKDRKGKGKMRESDYPPQDQLAVNSVDGNNGLMDDISPINRVADLPPMLRFSPEKPPRAKVQVESDSDEDVPLSRIKKGSKSRPASVFPSTQQVDSGDDSDVPLSRLRKSKSSAPPSDKPPLSLSTDFAPTLDIGLESATGSLGLNLPAPQSASEMTKPTTEEIGEDDDVPLLLRQAHIKSLAPKKESNDDDDDIPLGVRQSMLLSHSNSTPNVNMMSGFRPPDPALYAPNPNPYAGYPNFQQHPQAYAGSSMYGYPPAPAPGWGSHMWPQQQQMGYPPAGYPYHMPPQHTGMTHPYLASQHSGMQTQPQHTGLGGGMGMNIGQMSFPDLGAMMNAQGQAVPPPTSLEMGAGVQSGNIDSWRKGVDPVVPPAGSVGGGSRGS